MITGQEIAKLKELYYRDRLTQKEVAYKMGWSVALVREVMKENGLEVRSNSKGYPNRKVVGYREVPYDTTFDGKVLTKTVADLECGHIVKVWETTAPNVTGYRPVRSCPACGTKEKEDGNGSPEH